MSGRDRLMRVGLVMGVVLLFVLFVSFAQTAEPLDAPAQRACWPWKQATSETPHPGVTHWVDRSSTDGTVLHLYDFDFAANPRLRLELYDQDEDDAVPFDGKAAFWATGVGQATRHLNEKGRGPVVAIWNGLFFTADKWGRRDGLAGHVAPVVLDGKVYYNVSKIRWTFGVHYVENQPQFKVLHCPDRKTMEAEFTFAAAAAQCLIRDGAPLKLQPYPAPNDKPLPQPVPSTPEEAGHIPLVDHIKTSRTSMGWSKDHDHLYVLIVQEPGQEGESIQAFLKRQPVKGGWMVSDLQRFWQALGVWGAVNIDGGYVTQLAGLRKDGNYDMLPPCWVATDHLRTYPPTFAKAPEGGTLMYFFVRETKK